ncbi:MAG: CcoQ/FixQ family Cbb3-type cytochrome c oxidase assembly chaperone [Deltaproteobacteria bacterium]|jgi:cbb3-type cytochrome oxidase subunit 3|nr:CcoQ/FixQ family Cbb3-type cytochrome c oxidase assembly chaperone [Deltaproteobacteria bacterium]
MISQWLTHFNDVQLALVGFALFFSVFVMVLLWTYRKNSKNYYQNISELPFNDGDKI